MFVGTKEGQDSGQTQHLFHEDRSSEVSQDPQEATAEGQDCRQEISPDQAIGGGFTEVEGCPDQEGITARQELLTKGQGSFSDQIKNCQTQVIWTIRSFW